MYELIEFVGYTGGKVGYLERLEGVCQIEFAHGHSAHCPIDHPL
jgi:hypothetical protein